MENTFAFLSAALPWIAMALLLAIFFVRETGRKKDQEKQMDYGSEGRGFGRVSWSRNFDSHSHQCRHWYDGRDGTGASHRIGDKEKG